MHDGAAATQQVNGGAVHIESLEPGVVLSPAGEAVTSDRPTLMNRLDAKAQEKVTVSRGTLWLVGAGLVLLQVVFNYGGSLISWTREDQTQKEQIQMIKLQQIEMRDEVKAIKTQLDDMQKSSFTQAIQDAEKKGEVRGYQLKSAEGKHDGK